MVLWQPKAAAAAAGVNASKPDIADRGDRCEVLICVRVSRNLCSKNEPVRFGFVSSWMRSAVRTTVRQLT